MWEGGEHCVVDWGPGWLNEKEESRETAEHQGSVLSAPWLTVQWNLLLPTPAAFPAMMDSIPS